MKTDETPFPPQTFAQLRRIPTLIRRQELDLPMGKQTFAALCSMLDDPQLVAMNNISTLAKALAISPASLTRLSKLLGFRGFNSFQNLFRDQLAQPDRFYSRQAEALLKPGDDELGGTLGQMAEAACQSIHLALEQLDNGALEQAVEWLASAPRVHIFGYRQSAALASVTSYALSMIRTNVIQLGSNGQGLSIGLAQLRSQDVLVLFGSAPYSRETINAARIAHKQGHRLIAFTDSHLSPLAHLTETVLLAPSQGIFYSNSFCATLFLIEGVLTLVAKKLGQRALRNLEIREEFISRLNDGY